MKNLCTFISVVGILTSVPIVASDSPSPIIKQFEVDAYNNVIRPYEGVDKQRSELIVEKVDHLRLECYANYPVQWIYTGNGVCNILRRLKLENAVKKKLFCFFVFKRFL